MKIKQIIIAIYQYVSIAAVKDCINSLLNRNTNFTPIDLDIYTRESTDKVKVTRTEDGNMVIYKIAPQSGYKFVKFVDDNKVIHEITNNDNFKYLEVAHPKNTEEFIVISLHGSLYFIFKRTVNYFLFGDEWKEVDDSFYNFLVEKMKVCKLINRDTVFNEYDKHIEEVDKQKVEVDLSKKDEVASGITREDGSEFGLDVSLYVVDDKTVMSKVKTGNTEIWKRSDGEYGCYKMKVYHLPQDEKLLILAVRSQEYAKVIFCGKKSEGNYGQVKRQRFDNKLKEVDAESLRNTLENFIESVGENIQIDEDNEVELRNEEDVVKLDVHTRQSTDEVKVTRTENGNMIIYKIEPTNKCKICDVVDGDKVVYEPPKDDKYKHLEVKYSKLDETEPIIVSLIYSQTFINKFAMHYILFKGEWRRVNKGIVQYFNKLINDGGKINKELEAEAYFTYAKERCKNYKEIDFDNDNDIDGIIKKESVEDGVQVCIYKVNENSLIFKVQYKGHDIWKWKDYICGCYEIKLYHSSGVPVLIILTIRNMKETEILYYKRVNQTSYPLIKKEEFDEELLKTIQNLKSLSSTNKEGEDKSNNDER